MRNAPKNENCFPARFRRAIHLTNYTKTIYSTSELYLHDCDSKVNPTAD